MSRVVGGCAALLLCLSAPLAAATGRAIVVQLPGASGAELAALWHEGALDAGGFRPFFERGRVTTDLVPADPSYPFAAAVALSTGAAPGASGVVADRIRDGEGVPVDLASTRGLAGGVETLWGVAAAAERSVGAVLWPGLDNRGEASRASWGIADRDTEHYPSRSYRMQKQDWVDEKYGVGPGPSLFWGLPPTVKCYSPAVSFSVQFAMEHAKVDLIYTLVAIDRTDDGQVNYDGVLVSSKIDPKKGYVGIVEPGAWFRLDLEQPSGERRSTPEIAWIKVMELAPDLATARIHISSSHFIKAYPSALVRRLEEKSVAWTGRPDEAAYVAGRDTGYGLDETSFAESAGRLARFAVDVALAGRELFPTDLLLISLPVFDPIDRQLLLTDPRQPGYGEERARRCAAARRQVWQAIDRELARLLAGVDLESTTVFLVSPYVNLPVVADADVSELLREAPELAAVAPGAARAWRSVLADGGLAQVRLSIAGRDADGVLDAASARAAARAVRDVLAKASDGGKPIFARVMLREEAERMGLDRPESGDVLAFANPGYRLLDYSTATVPVTRKPAVRTAAGYWSGLPGNRGFLLSMGGAIDQPRTEPGVATTEVAKRVARSLGIRAPKKPR